MLSAKLRRFAHQIPYIPGTLALLLQAAPRYAAAWIALLILQASFPSPPTYFDPPSAVSLSPPSPPADPGSPPPSPSPPSPPSGSSSSPTSASTVGGIPSPATNAAPGTTIGSSPTPKPPPNSASSISRATSPPRSRTSAPA